MSRQLWARGIWGIVAVACSAAAVAAQQPRAAQQNPATQQQTQGAQQNQAGQPAQNNWNGAQTQRGLAGVGRTDLDHYLIKVLIKANKDEIEMGKLAEQRSQNADVKKLATQMVQDHTGFLSKLEGFKSTGNPGANQQAGTQHQMQRGTAYRGTPPGATADGGLNQQQPAQQSPNPQTQIPNPQLGQQQAGAHHIQFGMGGKRMHDQRLAGMGEHAAAGQFAKIMEEVDQNMQQSLVRELSSKQGAQFDRCFLTGQLFGHMWVAEALKTFERDASPQLKPILQEGVQSTEQHLTHIKSLLAKSENEPAATSARVQPRNGRFNQ